MNADTLVKCIEWHAAKGDHYIDSATYKQWLTGQGIDWGDPHGWPIRAAEDAEFAGQKRLVKWRAGRRVGYSLATCKTKPPTGWTKIK